MIIDKNKTLKFTLEGLKAPNTDDDKSPEYVEYSNNYDKLVEEINNFLHGIKTLYYNGVNLHGDNFTIGFSDSEDMSGLKDDELGMSFYNNERQIALVVVNIHKTFILTEKYKDLVTLEEIEK